MTTFSVANHTRTSVDERVAHLAGQQHGLVTRAQALRCGSSQRAIQRRVKAGRWTALFPGVYCLAGVPGTWRQRALAVCLHFGPGSALSHRSAALIRDLHRFDREPLELTVPRNRNRRAVPGAVVHSVPGGLATEDITTVEGIPVTSVPRTLLDLATIEPEASVERCLDDALRRRLVSLPFLTRWLQDPCRVGHRGAAMIERLVDARYERGVTESVLETDVLKLLRKAGLPSPILQYQVRDGGRLIARLDFAYPEHLVAIEADGFRFHAGRHAFDHDRARSNELQAMGWRILHITAKHLERDPGAVLAWVRRALNS